MIRDQILLENKFNSINLKCFACKQNNHLTLNCPYLHYIPDRDRIIRIYNFNPHQKHRKRYQRRADKSLNALYDKIPIKLSQKKFKEYLKHYNLMEDLSGSFDSFDLMTEKELFEMEKLKSPKNLEENTLNLNPNSYNIQHEKPLGIFSKINEDLNEESSLKDIIYKKEEEEKIFSECLVENFLNKSNTIFRTKANLEINTNNSKSKNIIEIRKKRRSVSSKYNENFSFISPNKNNEISRVSKNKFGRLNFKYEDLDSSNFRIPKKRENSAEYRKNNLSLIEKGFENISKQPQSIIFNGLEMGNSVENSNSPNHEIKRKESYKKVNLAESDVYFKKLSNPFAIKKQFSLCSNKTVEKSPLLKLPIHHTISQNEMKKKNEDRDDNNTMNETLSIRETNEAETALILNTKEMRFETVHNFKNYYPYNNIKEIIQSFIILKKKKRKDKRKKTMKFKNYFIEKQQKKKNSIEQNQILPMSEANNLFTDVNLDKDPQKRASNIFIDRSITMNFFKKPATKYTFYDIVYEVLKNKDLRKNLRDMRDKSQKNKFRNRLNIN